MITVFTPTYNRAYILPELYNSLLNQTCFDFEWLIVDDGSTDNTEELVKSWCDNGRFPVRYYKKENGGKPSAINMGLEYAQGEYFVIIDSDDTVVPTGVEISLKWMNNLPEGEKFAGAGGLRGNKEGGIIGTTFNGDYVDATTLERTKHNIGGDKTEIFYTEILKQFPFPVFEGEKFVPEAVIWNRIAKAGYKLRWFNEIVQITEYLADGYTQNVDKNLIKNWKGYSLYVKEVISSPCNIKDKVLIGGAYCLRGIKRICKMY